MFIESGGQDPESSELGYLSKEQFREFLQHTDPTAPVNAMTEQLWLHLGRLSSRPHEPELLIRKTDIVNESDGDIDKISDWLIDLDVFEELDARDKIEKIHGLGAVTIAAARSYVEFRIEKLKDIDWSAAHTECSEEQAAFELIQDWTNRPK